MSATAGRAWATTGFGLGITTSVAANIAHSYTLPTIHLGDVIASAFWPLALLVAVEIIVRVSWPTGTRWMVVRYGGLSAVALIAAFTSYRHMASLLGFYGEDALTSLISPIAVDGLMVLSSAALLAISDNIRRHLNPEKQPAIIGELIDNEPR